MAKVKRNVEHNSRETQKWIVCSVCVCHKERTQNQVLVLCTHCDQMPSHQIDVTSNLKVGNSKAFQRQTVYVLLGTPAKPNAVKRTCSRLGCDGPWVTPTHINCLCLAWIFYTNVINRCADRIPKIAPVPRTPPINKSEMWTWSSAKIGERQDSPRVSFTRTWSSLLSYSSGKEIHTETRYVSLNFIIQVNFEFWDRLESPIHFFIIQSRVTSWSFGVAKRSEGQCSLNSQTLFGSFPRTLPKETSEFTRR